MIKNNLIIFIHNLSLEGICDYIQQTQKILKNDNVVLNFYWQNALSLKELFKKFINSKDKFKYYYRQGSVIKIFPIHFLAFRRLGFIWKVNLYLNLLILNLFIFFSKDLRRKKRILWIFHPENENLVGSFSEQLSLYDCVDYYSSVDPGEDRFKKALEKKLIQKVSLVFTNSPILYQLKKRLHPHVFQVPQGCDIDLFLTAKKYAIPSALAKISRPRMGFLGNLDYRLDFNLIKQLSLQNPHVSCIFIGPLWQDKNQDRLLNTPKRLAELRRLPNIYFLKPVLKEKIIAYMDNIDAAIIPYNLNLEFCRFCYPMKVFEFFCRGKPILATPIKSLLPLQPYIQIAKNAKEFSLKTAKILKTGWPKEYIRKQKELAMANSWEKKIEKMSETIEKEPLLLH